jgi:hypothetical protein
LRQTSLNDDLAVRVVYDTPILDDIEKESKQRDKQIAELTLKLQKQEKRADAADKQVLIAQLDRANIDTKGFDKYSLQSLKDMVDMLGDQDKYSILKADVSPDPKPRVDQDPGWFDHAAVPGFPNGVWRSSVDNSIIDPRYMEINPKREDKK